MSIRTPSQERKKVEPVTCLLTSSVYALSPNSILKDDVQMAAPINKQEMQLDITIYAQLL